MSIKATVRNRLERNSLNVKKNEDNTVILTLMPGEEGTVPPDGEIVDLKSIDVEVDDPLTARVAAAPVPISVWPPSDVDVTVKPSKRGRAWKLKFSTIANFKSSAGTTKSAAEGDDEDPDDVSVTVGPDDPPPENNTSSALIFIGGVAVGFAIGIAVGAMVL